MATSATKIAAIFLLGLGTCVLLMSLISMHEDYQVFTPTEVKAIITDVYQQGAKAGIIFCINHKETI